MRCSKVNVAPASKHHINTRSGFTLVQLLVGVAIMGVILGAVVWNAHNAKRAVQATLYMRIPDAEAAIKQDPNNELAHERLADALCGHDSAQAITEYRTALRLQPNNREVQFRLAYELKYTGKISEAKSFYQRLATQNDLIGQSSKRDLQKLASP